MSLNYLIFLFILIFAAWLFWLRRGMAEAAKEHVIRYCRLHSLQVISVSRQRLTLTMVAGKPGWYAEYQFEFSGNHEDRYTGMLYMQNHHAIKIDVPPYRTA